MSNEDCVPFDHPWSEEWLARIADIIVGGTPSTSVESFWGGDIPWMSSGDVHLRRVSDVRGRITEKGLASSNATLVDPPAVVIALAGQGKTRGTVGLTFARLCGNQSIAFIKPRSVELNASFLFHSLEFRYDELRARSAGGGRAGLSKGILGRLPVCYPETTEQEAIANFLDTADDAISKTEVLIYKLKAIKQGLFHDLLTCGLDDNGELRDPTRDPRQFVDTSYGLIPRTWFVGAIGDLSDNLDAQRVPLKQSDRDERHGVFPYYGASGIIDWVDNYIFDGEFVLLAEDGANIVTRELPIAFPATGKIWVNNHAHVLRPRDGVDRRFLVELLEQTDFTPFVVGSAQPKLSQNGLSKLRFLIPKLAEQEAIGDALEAFNLDLVSEENYLAKLTAIRKGLMQDLLTGRVPATTNDFATWGKR